MEFRSDALEFVGRPVHGVELDVYRCFLGSAWREHGVDVCQRAACKKRDSLPSAMRKVFFIALLLLSATCLNLAPSLAQGAKPVDLVLFYGRGCPHCAAMQDFLQMMREKYPTLRLRQYEVYFSAANDRLFERMAHAYRVEILGVPTAFLGPQVFAGYADEMRPEFEAAIRRCIAQGCESPLTRVAGVAAKVRPLTVSAVLLGAAVDAINPCAFAVLIILITAVLGAGGRRRALYAGVAFSLSIFVSYYLMGVGLYSAVEAAGISRALYIAVAVLAILIGLFNLKDYLWYGKWFVMEVPLSWRPALKKTIQGVTSVPGAFFTGLAVSLFLLPCTSGPYIVILGLLAETETRVSAMLWLVLYNIVFVLPMIAITAAVYFGLTTAEKAEAWRTGHLQTLHLVAGAIILLLGLAMVASLWLGYV
jgi:cytochrome c biogenesis protein CcdA